MKVFMVFLSEWLTFRGLETPPTALYSRTDKFAPGCESRARVAVGICGEDEWTADLRGAARNPR